MRAFWKVVCIMLSIAGPVSAVAQLTTVAPSQKLELRLQPEAVLNGIPNAFTIILVNGSAHDVRVPSPSLECGDGPHGTIWLRMGFKSSTDGTLGISHGCANDSVYSPISAGISQWKILHPGESLVLATIDDRELAPKAGSYDYWAHYNPPGTSEADRDWLRKAGIDFPKEELDSSHVKFIKR